MRVRHVAVVASAVVLSGCAGTPGPGDSGYAYNVEGSYTGRLMVEETPFEAVLDLSTGRGGRVRGSFRVGVPFEIDGEASGAVIDDLLRLTVRYQSSVGGSAGQACDGTLEGILSIAVGGAVVEGPVTITDCGDALPGRMSFRQIS